MEDEDHKEYHRRLLYIIVVILILLIGGAMFYHHVEKWRYLDAFYFVTATMTTIGYGDIVPKTDIGRVFTIFFAFASVGMALYGLSVLASHFVEEREEFWFRRIGIKERTTLFRGKLSKLFGYKPKKLVSEYEKSIKNKK